MTRTTSRTGAIGAIAAFIRRRQAARDQRGAVYVEFLIAFFPIFTFFLGLIQLADLHQANIVTHHAAVMAVRTAIVVLPDDGQYYNNTAPNHFDGERRDAIKKAAMQSLLASRSITEFRVTLPSSPGGDDELKDVKRNDLVRVAITAHFQCRVPLVSKVVCNSEGMRTLRAESAMPNQGADYEY